LEYTNGEAREDKVSNDIWKYQGNTFRAHCTDMSLAKRMAGWEACQKSAIYYYPDGHSEMDVLFPAELYNRVAELLKLPLRQKNPKRVAQGQKMSVINKKHRFLRNTNLQKLDSEEVFEERSLGT
jgi:hypothetical protein